MIIYWEDLPPEYRFKLKLLQALEDAGVNNWEGYGAAVRHLFRSEEYEEEET